MRRHTEWINLVNANCDSRFPRTKRDLLRDLDIWDKTQGRQPNTGNIASTMTVMHKEFDGAAWAKNHDNDFKKLIAEARRKPSVQISLKDLQSGKSADVLGPHIMSNQSQPPPKEANANLINGQPESRHSQQSPHNIVDFVRKQV